MHKFNKRPMRAGMFLRHAALRRAAGPIVCPLPVAAARRQRSDAPIVSPDDYKLIPRTQTGAPPYATAARAESEALSEGTAPQSHSQSQSHTKSPSSPSPSASAAYAPWEIRALLLPLIPVGGAAVPLREIVHLLPRAAREEMQREGSPLAYIERHLKADVIVRGNDLLRRTIALDDRMDEEEGDRALNADSAGNSQRKAQSTSLPPPPLPPSAASSGNRPTPAASPGRTTLEVLDMLMEYIPTFFVQQQAVADQLPPEITRHYAGSTFLHFVKRFRHYVDIRAQHGSTEVRLRPDFAHAKRGAADARYASGLNGVDVMSQLARGRRPPRNSEANLIQFVVPRMPSAFTPLATVLQDVSDIVSRHPSFDSRLGVTGLFEKYPEYFQIVDGRLRVRPFRSAPNSLDDLCADTSPLPEIYQKLKAVIDAQAEGKDYGIDAERAAAAVPTGRLYALLTTAERRAVKEQCRSFPRFLRLHGAEIVVSVDSMRVWLFRPSYERCAETILDQRLAASALSPDDPVLRIPATMDEGTAADWAVRELYDALPLMQCAELAEVISLVPPSVRAALPQDTERLVGHLALYPDYFATWPYPDDTTVIVIQRAKLEIPQLEKEDIVRMVLPLVPQGGIDTARLMRRVPLPLQRHFYRLGLKRVLGGLTEHFLVVGDKVMRIG